MGTFYAIRLTEHVVASYALTTHLYPCTCTMVYAEAESDPQSFQKRFAPIDSSVQSTQLIDAMRFCETLLKNRYAHAFHR